jgi:CrcB protein
VRAIDVIWVCLGGGIGSLLRWQMGHLLDSRISARFRYGTFLINVTGAFVIAYLSMSMAIGWQQRFGDVISSLVITGILGGYTTFSSMQLDAVQMAEGRRHALALFYLVSSVLTGLIAAAAGVALAKA